MRSAQLAVWSPRVLGIAMAAFLGLFALDAFQEGQPLAAAAAAFALHLVPALVVLALVAVAWKREWIGAMGFVGLAVLYAASVGGRLDWVLAISGPLLIVGGLFLWSWRHHRHDRRLTPSP